MDQVSKPRLHRSFILLLLAFMTMIAAFLFINSPFFQVSNVVVIGNKYTPAEDVIDTAGISVNSNIFRINTADAAKKLRHDLRFVQASVTRRFPATVVISVTERQPLAYIAAGYGFAEIDQHGVVLAAYKNIKQMGVPMITGIRLDNAYVGDRVPDGVFSPILQYLAALPPEILAGLSEVNVQDKRNITAVTTNGVTIRLGDSTSLLDKASLTRDILADLAQNTTAIEYVDLSFSPPVIKFRRP